MDGFMPAWTQVRVICREQKSLAEEHMARIVPDNPAAFPPSMEVRCVRAALEHGRHAGMPTRM